MARTLEHARTSIQQQLVEIGEMGAARQKLRSERSIARDIQRHRHGRPIEARPPSIGYRLQKYAQRHRLGLVLGSLALLVLLASLGLALRQAQEARREAARAQAMQRLVLGLFDQAGAARQPADPALRELLAAGARRGAAGLGASWHGFPRARR